MIFRGLGRIKKLISSLGFVAIGGVVIGGQVSTADRAVKSDLRFTANSGTWMDIDISPNGREIVFELLGNLYLVPIAGGSARPLTNGSSYDSQPRFSRDGTRIVFISDKDGIENLWTIGADGTNLSKITAGDANRFQSPVWLNDDSILVSLGSRDKKALPEPRRPYRMSTYGLAMISLKSKTVRLLETGGNCLGACPDTSNDIVYIALSKKPTWLPGSTVNSWFIAALDLASGAVRDVIVRSEGGAFRPTLSADGKTLAYATRVRGETVYRMLNLVTNHDTSLEVTAQHDEQESFWARDLMPNAAFTPNGHEFLSFRDGNVWITNLSNGRSKVLKFTCEIKRPIERAKTHKYRIDERHLIAKQVRSFDISPDGNYVVFEALNRLWLKSLPSGEVAQLTEGREQVEYDPSWSRDGKQVVFAGWSVKGGGIYQVEVQEGKSKFLAKRLTSEAGYYENPVYSRDGRCIYLRRMPSGGAVVLPGNVYTMDLVRISQDGGPCETLCARLQPGRLSTVMDPSRLWLVTNNAEVFAIDLHAEKAKGIEVPSARLIAIAPDECSMLATSGFEGKVTLIRLRAAHAAKAIGMVSLETNSDMDAMALPAYVGSCLKWADNSKRFYYVVGSVLCIYDITLKAESALTQVSLEVKVPTTVPDEYTALVGATIITMGASGILRDGAILVKGGRIEAIGMRKDITIPPGARVLDLTGTTILPGYIDVHAHLGFQYGAVKTQPWTYAAHLAYGVTTAFDPYAQIDVFGYEDLVDYGVFKGPRILSTGPAITEVSDIASYSDAKRIIERYAFMYRTNYIKQYGAGSRCVRQWLRTAADERNVTSVFEVYMDTKKSMTEVMDGYTIMAHGWPVFPVKRDLVELMYATGVNYTATLSVTSGGPWTINYFYKTKKWASDAKVRHFVPEAIIAQDVREGNAWNADDKLRLHEHVQGIVAMVNRGINVTIGSHGELPGLGFHWEMEMHATGGLAAYDVLRAATINGAKALGVSRDIGSLEEGKIADLQVLTANPLSNIENTRGILYVMKEGRLYCADTLDEIFGD